MTATDMYKATVDARRAQLYGKIKSCAQNGNFRTRVYKDSLGHVEDVLDKLEKKTDFRSTVQTATPWK